MFYGAQFRAGENLQELAINLVLLYHTSTVIWILYSRCRLKFHKIFELYRTQILLYLATGSTFKSLNFYYAFYLYVRNDRNKHLLLKDLPPNGSTRCSVCAKKGFLCARTFILFFNGSSVCSSVSYLLSWYSISIHLTLDRFFSQ